MLKKSWKHFDFINIGVWCFMVLYFLSDRPQTLNFALIQFNLINFQNTKVGIFCLTSAETRIEYGN